MQILQRCVTLPHFEDKKVVKEKETVLSGASDGRNVSVCYILPQCLPAITVFSLLAVNIRAIYIAFGTVSM
jgi:hypothetical protein